MIGHFVPQGQPVIIRDPDGVPTTINDWRVAWLINEELNRQSKRFFVPPNEEHHILNIFVVYTADGVQGARQLVVDLEDYDHFLRARVIPNTTQDGGTVRHYNIGPGLANMDDFYDATVDWISTPIPPTWVVPGRTNLRIWEENAISAGDDMLVYVLIGRRLVR